MKIKTIAFFAFLLSFVLTGLAMADTTTTQTGNNGMQGMQMQNGSDAKLGPQQVKQIESIVHDYLIKNPQVIVEVIRKLQDQQVAEMQEKAVGAIKSNAQAIFNSSTSPVAGNANGTVTLVEFFDYQCPHCKAMATVIEDLITKNKNLKVVFKEFPIFPGSSYGSQAALAAAAQGKYFPFHTALMEDKNPLTKSDVIGSATKLGLDVKALEKAMQDKNVLGEIKANTDLAQTLGLGGTPAFIIQNNSDPKKVFFVPGQVSGDVLQEMINKAS